MPDTVLVAREMIVSNIKSLLSEISGKMSKQQTNHMLDAKYMKRDWIKVMVECCARQNYDVSQDFQFKCE